MKITNIQFEGPLILMVNFIKSIIASYLVIKSQQISFLFGIVLFSIAIALMMTDFKFKVSEE